MKKFAPAVVLLHALLCCSYCIQAQTQESAYPAEVAGQISRVENGLISWYKIQDSVSEMKLSARMAHYKLNGVSIAVVHNYQLVWAKGYGWADAATKRPVTPETRFQAASISKSVNALGVLLLADKQQLDLHADINNYLRSWKFPYDTTSHNKKITVAHLLSHTAGLSVHGFPGYNVNDTLPTDNEILDGKRPANTAAVRSVTEPGKRYQYSGGGTTITKKIIIDVTGMAYDAYMDKYVLQPLGMQHSSYTQPPPANTIPQLATAYSMMGEPVKGKYHIYPEQAADGLWTTPSDLARFVIALQQILKGEKKGILSKQLADTMLTPFMNPSAALGFFIDRKGSELYFQHGGSNQGFRCQFFGSFENGNGVVVMVNSDDGRIIPEIVNSVAIAYQWPEFYKPVVKKVVNVSADTLKTYTGQYQMNRGGDLTIIQQGDHLYLSQYGSPYVRLYFTSPGEFFIKETPGTATFEKNEKGIVDRLVIREGQEVTTAKRK